MENMFERIILLIVGLFFVVYFAFQITRFLGAPLKTQTALNYYTEESENVSGVIIRDEEVISVDESGTVCYLLEDGTRVTQQTVVAEFYSTSAELSNEMRIRALKEELKMLLESSDGQVAQFGNAQAISKQVDDELGTIISRAQSGVMGDISSNFLSINKLLNRREIATGKELDLAARTAQIEAQIATLQSSSHSYTNVKSPQMGFFVQVVDGYEDKLSVKDIELLTVADVKGYSGQRVTNLPGKFGKIVTNHLWYYAAVIPAENIPQYSIGSVVNLDFNLFNLTDIPFVVTGFITDEGGGEAVVLLRSNYILPELVAVRNPTAQIKLKSYSGIRVEQSAIRYDGLEKGVYIVENGTVRFRTISVIYETEDYVLCGSNVDDVRPLKLFDQVILEGKDLYDGKIID